MFDPMAKPAPRGSSFSANNRAEAGEPVKLVTKKCCFQRSSSATPGWYTKPDGPAGYDEIGGVKYAACPSNLGRYMPSFIHTL